MLFAYVLTTPFLQLSNIPISWVSVTLMDWQRIGELAVLLACLGWVFVFSPPLKNISMSSRVTWGIAFALGLMSSLIAATHIGFALLEWSWVLMLVILATVLHHWPMQNQPHLDRLLLMTVFISCLIYLWWFWQVNGHIYFAPPIPGITRRILFPGFSNIRFFSDYQAFLLLLLPTALNQLTSKGITRSLGAVLVAFFFALAVIAGSRSLIASHIILHLVLLLLFGKRYHPFLIEQLRFWVLGFIIFSAITWILPLILFSSSGDSLEAMNLARADSSHRSELWAWAWEYIQLHPLLGLGPMHYASLPNVLAAHPHNLILQFASEWGVPSTLLMGWMVAKIVVNKFKALTTTIDDSQRTSLALTCAGSALIAQSMVAGALNYPVTQVMALIFFAYPSAAHEQKHAPRNTASALPLPALGLIAMMVTMATLTTPQSIQSRNACFFYRHWPSERYAPRFWQQGWIVGDCGEGKSLISLPKKQTSDMPVKAPEIY